MTDALADATWSNEESFDDRPIIDLLNKVTDAWNCGDIETLLSAYWKNDNVRYAIGNQVVCGFASVADRFNETYPDPAAMGTLEFLKFEISEASPSEAEVVGGWRIKRTGRPKEGLFTLRLRWSAGNG